MLREASKMPGHFFPLKIKRTFIPVKTKKFHQGIYGAEASNDPAVAMVKSSFKIEAAFSSLKYCAPSSSI